MQASVDVVANIGELDSCTIRDGREIPEHIAEFLDDVWRVADVGGGIALLLLDDAEQRSDFAEQPQKWECECFVGRTVRFSYLGLIVVQPHRGAFITAHASSPLRSFRDRTALGTIGNCAVPAIPDPG